MLLLVSALSRRSGRLAQPGAAEELRVLRVTAQWRVARRCAPRSAPAPEGVLPCHAVGFVKYLSDQSTSCSE